MPFAEINGASLYYEVAGAGYPLFLLHSGLSDHSMWDQQWSVFAQHYRVIRYDFRGVGASSLPTESYSHVEDLQNLMQFLGINKAHVLGLSFGGRTALDFTLTYPEKVSALVLASSGFSGASPSEDSIARWEAIDAAWERGDKELANELEMQMWVDGPQRTPEQVNPDVRARLKATNARNFESTNQPGLGKPIEMEQPAAQRLGEVQVPTLAIVGDKDIPDVQQNYKHLTGEISGAQGKVIEGVAHFPSMEQPELFNRLVLDFLASVNV
jgi:pimeloyl-ACP methyl ester carboxylesterase